MTRFAIIFTPLCLLPGLEVAGEREKHTIRPDSEVQTQIDAAARAFTNRKLPWLDRYAKFEPLRQLAEEDPKRLVQQVWYYASKRSGEDPLAWGALYIAWYFRIRKDTFVDAALPYIDTDDRRLGELVRSALTTAENYSSAQPPDFSWYAGVLRADPQAPPAALVRHMFARDPSQAFRQFLVVYAAPPLGTVDRSYDELLWAENVVSDALRKEEILRRLAESEKPPEQSAARLEKLSREEANLQLARLSNHDAWWARLYVAEILRQHAQFRTPELIERLKADQHELVRRAILEIDKSKSQR